MSNEIKADYDSHGIDNLSGVEVTEATNITDEPIVNSGEVKEDQVEINMDEIDRAFNESISHNDDHFEADNIAIQVSEKRGYQGEHPYLDETVKRNKPNEPELVAFSGNTSKNIDKNGSPIQTVQNEGDSLGKSNSHVRLTDKELEMQFEDAIRDHAARAVTSEEQPIFNDTPESEAGSTQYSKYDSNRPSEKVHEDEVEEDINLKSFHGDLSIPANSELLNSNNAFATYNALSGQLPSLSILSNSNLAALPLSIVAADYLPPRIKLLINTLPTLDNLATQLLRIIGTGPYQKVLDLAAHSDTPAGAAFKDLTSLFEYTKRLYSEQDPFLNVEHIAPGMWKDGESAPSILRNREQTIESTLRKVNLATFIGATLGTIEVGFFYLNESFLEVFCPANSLDVSSSLSYMNEGSMNLQGSSNGSIGEKIGKLLKPQAALYLDLKTQAYISAIEAGERSREEILEDILPHNLDSILMERRKTKLLSPSELDFIERCHSRKETLLHYPPEKNLSEEYEWLRFLRDIIEYTSKNISFLIWGRRVRNPKEKSTASIPKDFEKSKISHDGETQKDQVSSDSSNFANKDTVVNEQDIESLTSNLLPSEIQEQQIHLRINPRSGAKSTQRRPWTREEEKALRHALELKGPLWSTILELFGAGGKISEALKNRTQVQLKDKARNWKMFFLKSGLPVPFYLQKVTGDLERDDRSRLNKRLNRNKKSAAAPVPGVTSLNNASSN